MKYLFDFETEDATDLHGILGFIDSDFSMTQLKSYIKSATKDVIQIIGETIYNIAADAFEEDEFTDDELVFLLRYAIALGAFRKFAPLSDVSYTTSGRLFRTDENTKSAFEWMIDKSDDAMERSYYSSVNEILRHIFSEMPEEAETITKAYKLSELFVYDLSVFQEFVNINDFYLLYFKLIPELRSAQNRLLKSRMGEKYEIFKANEEDSINTLAKQICVFFAMKNGLRKESVQLWPRGVIRETSGSKKHQSASQLDIESAVMYYDDELAQLLIQLETEVAKTNAKIGNVTMINFGSEDNFVTL